MKFLSSSLLVFLLASASEGQPLLDPASWSDQGLGCDRGVCNSIALETRGCRSNLCLKRGSSDELGPFWANRGKRDPMYRQEQLFADEPHWILVRRDEEGAQVSDYDPFFVTRGKKRSENLRRLLLGRRNRPDSSNDSTFYATKKAEELPE